MNVRIVAALLAAGLGTPLIAQPAQAPAATVRPLASGAAAEVVAEVIKDVRRAYVHPERVDAIVGRLESALASGRYRTASQGELAELMTADLKAGSSNDGHMYINFKPDEAAAMMRPRDPQGQAGDNFFKQQMAMNNHGISELKVLPGNVRYMNLSQWFWDPAATPQVYDDAARFLRGGDAIIIDISKNGGGSAEAVNYLVSHFMAPDQKLMTFRQGPSEVEETRTQKVPGGQIGGKPLYVLIGPRSGSASEEFASHIRNFKLGTLVGQTTAGAGNPNSLFAIPHGFVLSVSTGLAIHPVTGKGWEGTGVEPHVRADVPRALDIAHAAALKDALASAPAERRAAMQWTIDALLADAAAARPTADQLRAFAGNYEGDRTVSERGGTLYWRRGDGPQLELVPMGGNRFAIGDRFGTRVEFDGASGLTLTSPTRSAERVRRANG